TVGRPTVIIPPWAVASPRRDAGMPPIIVVEPQGMSTSGPPAQVAMSVARAAGMLPINTVGQPAGKIGPPTCGTTPGTIGQVCMSATRAAGKPINCFLPKATATTHEQFIYFFGASSFQRFLPAATSCPSARYCLYFAGILGGSATAAKITALAAVVAAR